MNAEELRLRRLELEARLTRILARELAAFREQTGLSVRRVSVGLVDIQAYAGKKAIYVVSDVRCEVAV